LDPSKCRMYGPGLNPEGVRATLPATFTVDCTEAGKGPLEVDLSTFFLFLFSMKSVTV